MNKRTVDLEIFSIANCRIGRTPKETQIVDCWIKKRTFDRKPLICTIRMIILSKFLSDNLDKLRFSEKEINKLNLTS